MERDFERVAIFGVGLIGGSLGLALKQSMPGIHVRGVGRVKARLELARQMGAVDDCSTRIEEALADRDLVILAMPVDGIVTSLEAIEGALSPGVLVTDVGSTKRWICDAAWRILPHSVEFIGGHPVAGREVAGVEHSLGSLFEGAPYVFCPRPGTNSPGLPRLVRLAEEIGARPFTLTPDEHDLAVAWISHLPQLIATALAVAVRDRRTDLSGSGLRDMLRLAGSSYPVWSSILETNRDLIDQSLAGFIGELEEVRRRLQAGSLAEEFEIAARVQRVIGSRP